MLVPLTLVSSWRLRAPSPQECAIRSIVGWMPVHLNVHLAEADAPDEMVYDMEQIYRAFGHAKKTIEDIVRVALVADVRQIN